CGAPNEAGHGHRGKVQAEKAAADSENTVGFFECALDARHVADAERDGYAIETAVGIGEFLGVALFEGNHTVEPALPSALAPDLEHVSVDVANRDARARTARVRHPERHVARAAGEIEQRERTLAFRWVHPCHQPVFPAP